VHRRIVGVRRLQIGGLWLDPWTHVISEPRADGEHRVYTPRIPLLVLAHLALHGGPDGMPFGRLAEELALNPLTLQSRIRRINALLEREFPDALRVVADEGWRRLRGSGVADSLSSAQIDPDDWVVRAGSFAIDVWSGTLTAAGVDTPIELERGEAAATALLMERTGEQVSPAELAAAADDSHPCDLDRVIAWIEGTGRAHVAIVPDGDLRFVLDEA
jgi:hypothetical protein